MTTKKSTFLGIITAGGILLITSAGLIVANAQTTTTTTSNSSSSLSSQVGRMMNRPNEATHKAIDTAMDNKDYEAWKIAVTKDPKAAEILKSIDSQAKFDRLVVGHEAMKSGDKTTAEAIRTELGLPTPPAGGHRPDGKNDTNRQTEITALDNGDYSAWKTAIANSPRSTELLKAVDNEAKFQRFVAMHTAMKSGDKTTADSIRTELGLPTPPADGQGMKGGKGMKHNQSSTAA
ncbi:MAG: hypothetical protein WCK98_06010 [bacterium]